MIAVNKRRLFTLILSIVMVISLVACSERPEPQSGSSAPSSGPASSPNGNVAGIFANPLPVPTKASTVGVADTGFLKRAQEKHAINSDTVGWLQIPGTTIDDVILWYPGDVNQYYLRRDFDKVPNTGPLASQYGSYFAHYTATFNGGGAGMVRNTTIYGHSMEDDPDGDGFSQLKKFLDEDFAKKTPYIYFSTTDEDMAWEVFAVFYTSINVPYHRPNESVEEFQSVIVDEVLPRSIYNYECGVTEDDKILTLSTCCYNLTPVYPNDYRYVVMAKLVPAGKVTKTEASFEINPSPKAA